MDINPDDKCAACGTKRSDLPVEEMKDPETGADIKVQRFALLNAQWGFYVCANDIDIYNAVEPLAAEWPLLSNIPDAQKALLDAVFEISDRAYPLFKKMTV